MNLKYVRLSPLAIPPNKSRDDDAGYDLFSTEDYVLKPFERKLFKTDIALAIPFGYEGHIRDRSGKALRDGIHVLGGEIDASYRGNVGVILYNTNSDQRIEFNKNFKFEKDTFWNRWFTPTSLDCFAKSQPPLYKVITSFDKDIVIKKGDKIAQIVISACANFPLEEVVSLEDTDRGAKGFGSSGT